VSDTKTTLTWLLRDQVSGPARNISGSLDKLGLKAKTNSGLMGKLGTATGGLINPTALLTTGIFALGGALLGAGKAAIDEEKNVAKLTASLRANIVGWNGNTDAIEQMITSREELAFSDDDLRNSLALLVGATHDVNEAFAIQYDAMNLARYSGRSLDDATKALIKTNEGSNRLLKELGITISEDATQAQILSEVERVTAGQAVAYAETHAGAWEKIGIKIGDATEGIGGLLLATLDWAGKAWSAIGDVNYALAKMIGLEDKAATGYNRISGIGSALKASSGGGPGDRRASGGPVMAGQTYTVGEHGPETLVMGGGSGTVLPNGGGFTIQGVSAAQIADMVDRELYFKLSRSSPSATRK
jgi:hypothetical protein